MGLKPSKRGAHKHDWGGAPSEGSLFEVADLERSTAGDRQHNSLGMPDDVIALIATYLDMRDLGRVARVCKTWRRVALKDVVCATL
jgi:hypothetical protein